MTPLRPDVLLMLAGVAIIVVLASWVGRWWTRRKLERWAASLGLRLVEFRGEPFWRGPRAWRRTENQYDVRVVVEDREGLRREGWVLFTTPWHSLGRQRIDVIWDDV